MKTVHFGNIAHVIQTSREIVIGKREWENKNCNAMCILFRYDEFAIKELPLLESTHLSSSSVQNDSPIANEEANISFGCLNVSFVPS